MKRNQLVLGKVLRKNQKQFNLYDLDHLKLS